MPATLTPGGYVFRVSCARRATLTVLEPETDYTQTMLADDLGPQSSQAGSAAASARLDAKTRSLGGVDCASGTPGQFAITLAAGSYWFAALPRPGEGVEPEDVVPQEAPMTVTVSGPATATRMPAPDGTAAARDDRSWTLPQAAPASGTLLLRNPAARSHSLLLDPVPEDLTAQQWLEATRLGRGVDGVGTARLSAGAEMLWMYDLPPGAYVAMDVSIGENGYPQPYGAGAVIINLT